MRTHTIKLEEGKDVPQSLWGTEISVNRYESAEEAIAAGAYSETRAVIDKAEGQRLIEVRAAIRAALKGGKSLEDAVAAGNKVQIKPTRFADPNAPKTPKSSGEIKRAKAVQDDVFEAIRANLDNEKNLNTLRKLAPKVYTDERIAEVRAAVEAEAASTGETK